jgi:predicted RNase H-like HicB family nuclease
MSEELKWGDRKTVKEALQCLEHVKRNLFEDYLKNGVEIPEPEREILTSEGL